MSISSLCSRLVLIVPLCVTTSCAAMFTGTSDMVTFTSNPPRCIVRVDDNEGQTPYSIKISKKIKEATFVHPDTGEERTVELKRTYQTGMLLMDILFTPGYGLVGIIVDGSTAAWYKHDPQSYVDFDEPAPVEGEDDGEETAETEEQTEEETEA